MQAAVRLDHTLLALDSEHGPTVPVVANVVSAGEARTAEPGEDVREEARGRATRRSASRTRGGARRPAGGSRMRRSSSGASAPSLSAAKAAPLDAEALELRAARDLGRPAAGLNWRRRPADVGAAPFWTSCGRSSPS